MCHARLQVCLLTHHFLLLLAKLTVDTNNCSSREIRFYCSVFSSLSTQACSLVSILLYKFSKKEGKRNPPPPKKKVFATTRQIVFKISEELFASTPNTPNTPDPLTGWTFVDHSLQTTRGGVSGVCRACVERRRHDLDAFDFVHLRQHLKRNFRHAFFSSENVMSVRSVPRDSLDSSLSVFLAFSVFMRPF